MADLRQELTAALHGIDYPATRNKLITVALENGASRDVIDRISAFPETADFLNAAAVERAFGVHVPGEQPHGWE